LHSRGSTQENQNFQRVSKTANNQIIAVSKAPSQEICYFEGL